jgi:hypothetical protein
MIDATMQALSDRMEGFIELGMKAETLKLAASCLRSEKMTAPLLHDAVRAILAMADDTCTWQAQVEAAYAKLPPPEQPFTRFGMIAFRYSCHDYEGIIELLSPGGIDDLDGTELAWSLEAAVILGRSALADNLARQAVTMLPHTPEASVRSPLLLALAEYYMRQRAWDAAFEALTGVCSDSVFFHNAYEKIVEIRVAQAFLALNEGFGQIEQLDHNPDPKLELTLPGTHKRLLADAHKQFHRFQQKLRKMVSSKRCLELNLATTARPSF